MYKRIISIFITVILGGCASTNPCGEPSTGQCLSVSDNYKRSYTNYTNPDDLDNPGLFGSSSNSSNSKDLIKMNFNKYAQTPADGAPLLSPPKMMRIWLTSYTDNDNIYHDQSYEYVIVDRGAWNYSNNKLLSQPTIMNVSPDQVTSTGHGGYGSFGLANQPPKQESAVMPKIAGFPAINSLQQQQAPVITTTTIGSGVDRTTNIMP